MTIHIRMLHVKDMPLLQVMDTGIEDDYVLRIADSLMQGDNRLFGLFVDDTLVSLVGYSIFANRYAMLGRLRSDQRYMKKGYATKLMGYARDAAFQIPGIEWVGANTQEDNPSARRVMEKIHLAPLTMLHGATTSDVSSLAKEASPWKQIIDINRKQTWLMHTYVKKELIFPYECFYLFPSSAALFPDEVINEWNFYENNDQTRFVITKTDQKKHLYLQIAYPWEDILDQPGLWATVARDYNALRNETNEASYMWLDMPKTQAQSLPEGHNWTLPSPWILYGIDKTT